MDRGDGRVPVGLGRDELVPEQARGELWRHDDAATREKRGEESCQQAWSRLKSSLVWCCAADAVKGLAVDMEERHDEVRPIGRRELVGVLNVAHGRRKVHVGKWNS